MLLGDFGRGPARPADPFSPRNAEPMTPDHRRHRTDATPRRAALARILTLATVAALAMSGPAWAWGRLGHRMAGKVAEDRLTPNALKAVRDLLGPGESIADVSSWADEYRRDHRETAPWHYINIPISEPGYHRKFEPAEGCVVAKVDDFKQILADPATPRDERIKALKFLIHFVQDMHQPVHVGHRDDKGGNDLQVQFFEKGSNLHSVWDSGLLDKAGRPEGEYVALIESRITPEMASEWSKGETRDWAAESLEAARGAYRDPFSGAELKKGARLGQPYQDANITTAERRVAQAGVRLAAILNETFP